MRAAIRVASIAATLGACAGSGCTDGSAGGDAEVAIVGPAPDYVVSAVGAPPASAAVGASFSITVTVQNTGSAAATISSTTRHFLSLDEVVGGDRGFAVSTTVPALAVGAADTRSVTLTLPSAPDGSYHVVACADRSAVIPELDNRNNCRASSTTVTLASPDLVVDAVADPPPILLPSSTFQITDTTRNAGTVAAATTKVTYFLSATPAREPASHRLQPARTVSALAPGAAATGSVTTFAPPDLAPGPYYVVACADIPNRVPEADEHNNCRASTGTLTIPAPDLAVTSLAEPPAALDAGEIVELTATTTNVGNLAVRFSSTRFFLSADALPGDDLPVVGGQLVPSLGAAEARTLTTRIGIADTTPTGSYFLLACADAPGVIPEPSEVNNCRISAGQVAVTRPAPQAALVTVHLLGRDFSGDPEPAQPVLAHGPDGALVDRVTTDATDTAQILVPPGGTLTVVEETPRQITTFHALEDGDELLVGDLARFDFLGVGTVTLPTGPLEDNQYIVLGECAISGLGDTETFEVSLSGDCEAGPAPMMATDFHTNFSTVQAYLLDLAVDLAPGGTATLDGTWQPAITFLLDVIGIPEQVGSGASFRLSRLVGTDRVYVWQGPSEGETFTMSGGHLVGVLQQAGGGDGTLTDLQIGLNRVLEYHAEDITSMSIDVSDDVVTRPTQAFPIQGELTPGGPLDTVGMRWDMEDGAAVDGMVVWIAKFPLDAPPLAWTVVTPARPIGANQVLLPQLPDDLVPVWAGEQLGDWTVSAVDSPAASYAGFRPDAEPQRRWLWGTLRPVVPGKTRIGSSN